MLLEHQGEHGSQWAAIGSIATKIGCTAKTQWGAVREGGTSRKADSDGRVRIRFVRATDLRGPGDRDKVRWSHFTTLTLDVR